MVNVEKSWPSYTTTDGTELTEICVDNDRAAWHDLSYTALSGKVSLPRNEKPVASWGDRDSAWADVAQGLRQIAVSLS